MSLRIRVYIRAGDTGHRHYIYDEGAGAEDNREILYRSSVVKSLGCTLLPMLFDPADTEVEGTDLDRLEQEITTVVQNKDLIIRETGHNADYFDYDFQSIAKAVQLAKIVNGGVDVL